MADSERTDEDLVRASQRGDEGAFGELVRRHLTLSLAVAWEYCGSRDDAEDVVQDAFCRALQGLERFDPVRPFRPWFLTILRNVARTATAERPSRQHVALSESIPEGGATPFEEAERAEIGRRIQEAAQELPTMQRKCFRLTYIEGFTSVEIAEALGVSQATVRTHVARARRALSRLLEAFEEDYRRDGQNEE